MPSVCHVHYLILVDPTTNTDKFYIVCDFGVGKAVTGYGKRTDGNAGTFLNVTPQKAAVKLREKRTKGYVPAQPSDIPQAALDELLGKASLVLGSSCRLDINGNIDVAQGNPAAPPRKPAAAPRRTRASNHKVWFCPYDAK